MFNKKRSHTHKAFLTNNKGFSLIGVLVASAIGIIVILGISTAIVNQAIM